jgi:uncharacterized iron-regulated membrane protein
VQLGSATVTIRNEWAVWVLSFITLNIYGIIWWYQVNRELRDVAREADVRVAAAPAVSAVLMALWPLGLIPPLVTVFITSGRLRLVQGAVEADDRANPIIATLLFPLLLFHSVYLQKKLNSTWQQARRST